MSCFEGLCDLHALARAKRVQLMSQIDVGEVWGVGKRIAVRLYNMGIHAVLNLRNAKPAEICKHFNVVLERTSQELRGMP